MHGNSEQLMIAVCKSNALLYTLAAPYSHPQNLSGAALSSTRISLRWLPPPTHLINGILRYYHILITDPAGANVHNSLLDGNLLDLLVDGLHPYYTYNCSVTAVTVGDGPSSVLQIQTMQDGKL